MRGSIAAHYGASKGAVRLMTKSIAVQCARDGIRCNSVHPGPVDTDLAAPFPMDKTSPNAVARAILIGLESGEEDIFPDPVSAEMHSGILQDPKAVERQAGEMLPAA